MDARKARLLMIIDALRKLGKPIDEQIAAVLSSDEALGRPHIARAMVAAGHVATVQQAFDDWIDRKGPAYVPRQGMHSRAAIDAITAAGGLPVLAHYPAAPDQPELIDLLMSWGLRGLEVYYRRFTAANRQTDGCVRRLARARCDGWLGLPWRRHDLRRGPADDLRAARGRRPPARGARGDWHLCAPAICDGLTASVLALSIFIALPALADRKTVMREAFRPRLRA